MSTKMFADLAPRNINPKPPVQQNNQQNQQQQGQPKKKSL